MRPAPSVANAAPSTRRAANSASGEIKIRPAAERAPISPACLRQSRGSITTSTPASAGRSRATPSPAPNRAKRSVFPTRSNGLSAAVGHPCRSATSSARQRLRGLHWGQLGCGETKESGRQRNHEDAGPRPPERSRCALWQTTVTADRLLYGSNKAVDHLRRSAVPAPRYSRQDGTAPDRASGCAPGSAS